MRLIEFSRSTGGLVQYLTGFSRPLAIERYEVHPCVQREPLVLARPRVVLLARDHQLVGADPRICIPAGSSGYPTFFLTLLEHERRIRHRAVAVPTRPNGGCDAQRDPRTQDAGRRTQARSFFTFLIGFLVFLASTAVSWDSLAVANGLLDPGEFSYVVYIDLPGGGYCSGVLVTPGYVLTARHCVTGDNWKCAPQAAEGTTDDETKGNYTIHFNLSVPNQSFTTAHTYTIETDDHRTYKYPVPVLSNDKIDSCSKADSSVDFALLRLDHRVPVSSVRPMHVPLLSYPSCAHSPDVPTSFQGTLVGYGGTDWQLPPGSDDDIEAVISAGGGLDSRSTATDEFATPIPIPALIPYLEHRFAREEVQPNIQQQAECLIYPFMPACIDDCKPKPLPLGVVCPLDLPGATYDYYVDKNDFWLHQYYGGLAGDSGGPLLTDKDVIAEPPPSGILGNPDGRLLCGVFSRFYYAEPGNHWQLPDEIGSEYAALDSQKAEDYLASELVAVDGNFKGECFAGGSDLLRDQDSDGDLIPDACDPCPHYYDAYYDLEVGAPGDPNGDDPDGDGVPERCDNCHGVYNPIVEILDWRGQPDHDGDGYGDACDHLCPDTNQIVAAKDHTATDYQCCTTDEDCDPGKCGIIASGSGVLWSPPVCVPGDTRGQIFANPKVNLGNPCSSHCSAPVDRDCDTVPDGCDNCPFKPNDQQDTDGDGPGDACDNCPGSLDGTHHTQDENPPCKYLDPTEGDAACQKLHPNSICLPGYLNKPPPGNVSRCSRMPDFDSDGVGDTCDNCYFRKNPLQHNCNSDIEIARGMVYPYAGDACDPNPCGDLTHYYEDAYEQQHGSIEHLSYRPLFLPQKFSVWKYNYQFQYTPVTHNVQPPKATVGMRFCKCDIGMPNPSADDCASAAQCLLDSNEYTKTPPDTNWHITTLSEDVQSPIFPPSAEYPDLHVIDPVPGDSEVGFESIFSLGTFQCHWWVSADSTNFGMGDNSLTGLLWSHVPFVSGIAANGYPTAEDAFYPSSNHYTWGEFGHKIFQTSAPWALEPLVIKPIVITEPAEPPWAQLADLADVQNLVIDQSTVMVQARGATFATDLTPLMSAGAIDALYATDVKWVAPAEVEPWLGAHPVQLAAVSSNGAAARSVLAPVQGTLTDTLQWCTTHYCGPLATLAASTGSALEGRTRYGLVLSRREGALFVIGGLKEADQSPAGDIRRFDLTRQSWMSFLVGGAGVGPVLAATYRPHDELLYVMDEVRVGGAKLARLLAIDPVSRISKVLGTWPRKQVDRVFITNTHRATLLLVGSGPQTYKGVELAVNESGAIQALHGFAGKGRVAAEPHLTAHGLTVPLEDAVHAIRNEFVPAEELKKKLVVVKPDECL
jgi:hypothetical protein